MEYGRNKFGGALISGAECKDSKAFADICIPSETDG